MRIFASVLTVCLVAAGFAGPVSTSQQASAVSISGTVVDPAGTPIPGVSLELKQGTASRQRTVSDAKGAWTFDKVAPGSYQIEATLAGFATTIASVAVGAKPLLDVRIPMKVGQLAETVTVISESEALRRDGLVSPRDVPGGVVGGAVGRLPNAPPPPASAMPMGRGFAAGVVGAPAETATYAQIDENRFRRVSEHPLSTFSTDVDTASYANVRRFLNEGRLPPADAVRVEELINYFKYDYPAPRGDAPVAVVTEVAACPWNSNNRLALVGLRAKPIDNGKTPPRNLTFLLDVSGSMSPQNRLPLVKAAMKMLVDSLRAEDSVAIVVYAGASGVVLKQTAGDRKIEILQAIDRLQAAGSTNGAAGIQLAYDLALEGFKKNGINRVILATDGDFNVGITNRNDLTRLIEEKRERGIFLSVLGVGDNNLQDATMEMLADKGNGNYSYLDSLQEARRVLIAEAGSTLVAVAKDVKLQVEFNPRFVAAYRLVGYENRVMRKEDFNNDRKDAGEMGAGHTVTALYEIVPVGQPIPNGDVDPLKYQDTKPAPAPAPSSNTTELMNVKMRYKAPDGDASRMLEFPVRNGQPRMTPNIGWASAVAQFGMMLRKSEFKGSSTWETVASLAREHRGADPDGYRAEFLRLIDVAQALDSRRTTTDSEARR